MGNGKDSFEILLSLTNKKIVGPAQTILNGAGYKSFTIDDQNLSDSILPDLLILDSQTLPKFKDLLKGRDRATQILIVKDGSSSIDFKEDSWNSNSINFWNVNLPLVEEEFLSIIAKACIVQELEIENLLLRSIHKPNTSDFFAKFIFYFDERDN